MVTEDPDELPKVGEWYLEADTDEELQIIDVDADEGTIEVQYYDGNIDSFTIADWKAMAPQPIEPPEDWSGPMDSLEDEDVDYDEEPSDQTTPRHRTRDDILSDNFSDEEGRGSNGWGDD